MFDDHEVFNNYDGVNKNKHYLHAIGLWHRFFGSRNPSPPPSASSDSVIFFPLPPSYETTLLPFFPTLSSPPRPEG